MVFGKQRNERPAIDDAGFRADQTGEGPIPFNDVTVFIEHRDTNRRFVKQMEKARIDLCTESRSTGTAERSRTSIQV